MTKSGNRHKKRTTRGWHLCVEWNDGTTNWIPLKDLRESNPIELAEYAVANRIHEEPAFHWWVPFVIRKRNRIVSKVKAKYWRLTHKFGIELPHSVAEAYAIDKQTGTLHWTRAIEKEMKKVLDLNAFEKQAEKTPAEIRQDATKLPGYSEIGLHMVFDVKLDGKFTRKARLVANGNETQALPKYERYASVVSRESVRIGFLYTALNDLDILSCDVTNAYLNAPCTERLWTEAGPEFGSDKGSVMILKKAVYGLQSAGSSWHHTLAKTLEEIGFVPSRADPDVWLKEATKPTGERYYQWITCYVDDLLAISHDPKSIMANIAKTYDFKDGAQPPDRYLGANISRWQLPDGREVWSMSGKDYIKQALKLVRDMLSKKGLTLPTGKATERPMRKDYRPEIDVSPELGKADTAEYQQLIGMLRWGVELGRLDYLYELSTLSAHLALPREGHLEAVYGIFAYLAKHEDSSIVFDDKVPSLDLSGFSTTDWGKSIYGDISEERPRQAPEPLGLPMKMYCFVDASHAGDLATRRSHTGFIIYLNNAPIQWYSRRQNTVETSTFGAELVAMRTATEAIRALRLKLMLLGIPIEEPTYLMGDNKSVIDSTSNVEATLNKKHQAICWHAVREAAASGYIRIGWEPTQTNISDLFTKVLDTPKRRGLLRCIFPKGG